MKAKLAAAILFAVAGVPATSTPALAQESGGASQPQVAGKRDSKPDPNKPRKVWTDDDVSSLRSPADSYVNGKETEAATAAAAATGEAAKPAAANTPPAASQPHHGGPPVLTDPKSTADADKMIAWEGRDIEAQQENLRNIQKEIDEAPPERRAALQKLLQERTQVLEETRKEAQALQEKKEALQSPSAASNNKPAEQPPSQ